MAVYDSSISDDVSLSRILDAFIEEGESSSTVVKFLKLHEDCFSDIAARSLLVDRVFCSHYLKDCSAQDALWLLEHLGCIDVQQACYCAWQILLDAHINKMNCPIVLAEMSRKAADFVRVAAPKNGVRHPHSSYGYSEVKMFDYAVAENGICPELLFDNMTLDGANRVLKGISMSLFAGRLMQLDVFESSSDQVKYLMLNDSAYAPSFILMKFLKQLLTSRVDPSVKYEVIKKNLIAHAYDRRAAYSSIGLPCTVSTDLYKVLSHAKSYPEIAIQLQLQGEDAIADSIFTLLYLNKHKVLAEMAEMDEDTMQKNFPVKDLVDYIKANTCLVEADEHKQKGAHYAA